MIINNGRTLLMIYFLKLAEKTILCLCTLFLSKHTLDDYIFLIDLQNSYKSFVCSHPVFWYNTCCGRLNYIFLMGFLQSCRVKKKIGKEQKKKKKELRSYFCCPRVLLGCVVRCSFVSKTAGNDCGRERSAILVYQKRNTTETCLP